MLILIGMSLLVAVGFLVAFIRSTKAGDFEDMVTPSVRMLGDEPANTHGHSTEKSEIS